MLFYKSISSSLVFFSVCIVALGSVCSAAVIPINLEQDVTIATGNNEVSEKASSLERRSPEPAAKDKKKKKGGKKDKKKDKKNKKDAAASTTSAATAAATPAST